MKKFFFILSLSTMALVTRLPAQDLAIGFVNFKKCVDESKHGRQERDTLESLQKKMTEQLQNTDGELAEVAGKLQDQDYMDGLSPTAEEELKTKAQALNEELMRFQNQYYQFMQQANYKIVQDLRDFVSKAAEKVRSENELSLILNEESAFASVPSLDFTDAVVAEMDKEYDIANVVSADDETA